MTLPSRALTLCRTYEDKDSLRLPIAAMDSDVMKGLDPIDTIRRNLSEPLATLYLSHFHPECMNEDFVRVLNCALGALESLRTLILRESFSPIFSDGLQKLTGLTCLDLSNNYLGETQLLPTVLRGIAMQPSLTSLNMSCNKLNHLQVHDHPLLTQTLQQLTNLVFLSLRRNNLSHSALASAIFPALPPSLTQLDVQNIQSGIEAVNAIPRFTALTQLDLGNEGLKLSNQAVTAFASALPLLPSLKTLDLTDNPKLFANEEIISRLPLLTSLKTLNLGANHIGKHETVARSFANVLLKLTSLEQLDISGGLLVGPEIASSLEHLAAGTSLKRVELGYNGQLPQNRNINTGVAENAHLYQNQVAISLRTLCLMHHASSLDFLIRIEDGCVS
jgi:hypothetical protein